MDLLSNQLQHVSILRGTVRGDPQEPLYRGRSWILFVCLDILPVICNHNEADICLGQGSQFRKEASGRSSVGANQR
jgi:hypothetical protein